MFASYLYGRSFATCRRSAKRSHRVKVVHASKAYFPHLGGIETVVRQVAEDQASRGHEVAAVVSGDSSRTVSDEIAGVRVVRVGAPARVASLPISAANPWALARQEADILRAVLQEQ